MKTPESMNLAISSRCNLRCTYCSFFTSAGDVQEELSTEEWLKFFEELNRCSVMRVCIEGSEPFVREDLPELIDGIVKNRMRYFILSNGTLITDEMAAFLKSTGRCESVQVSIDGDRPEEHESMRGDGTFHLAVRGLECLRRHEVPVAVRLTIHRGNVHRLEEAARFLLEDMGLSHFSTNSASHFGKCREKPHDVQLTVEEYGLAMETILRLERKYEGRVGAQAGPLSSVRDWILMEQARRAGLDGLPRRGSLTSCGGVWKRLDVRSDGALVPCGQMPHIVVGWANKDSLERVWQEHPELWRLRFRNQLPLREVSSCAGCPYTEYCAGGCPASAYTITGHDHESSPEDCLRRFLEAGGQLPPEELWDPPPFEVEAGTEAALAGKTR
ncbi:MAG: SynChlorMet cassette radical SAM/SPASM protein ScmE [bacterium]|nr:SynChlorMet cassette radical SAM/SPASM protein ScmE [bacterium]